MAVGAVCSAGAGRDGIPAAQSSAWAPSLRLPSPSIPRPGRTLSGLSVTVSKHHETTEMAEYFVALLLEGAEAFGRQSADQVEQHNTTSAGRIAEVAFVEENGYRIYLQFQWDAFGQCCSGGWYSW